MSNEPHRQLIPTNPNRSAAQSLITTSGLLPTATADQYNSLHPLLRVQPSPAHDDDLDMLRRSGRASSADKASSGVNTERRRASRTDVSGLWCDRGQVLDLSDRGIRLTTPRRWSEGQIKNLTLTHSGSSVTLCARCVWCRQESLFNHAVGLAFDHITDDQRDTLRTIAQRHASSD